MSEQDKLTSDILALRTELNHDDQANDSTDQRAGVAKISVCASSDKEGTIESNLHNPEEGSQSHAHLLLPGQLESADLVDRHQQNEQIGDDVGDLHAVVEGHQIDTLAALHRGRPSLVDR